ncbi:hypothetical protein HPB49_000680 [Dermacentor silvarum]|uniref:Uncharacterized protein n=1 Tax=Dermacentor silvarum TaxID=543639 RepID=A0ACB8D9B2_DERSI|nr:hypothetical protein HPB49_000680 [Dermacentor silvarum]
MPAAHQSLYTDYMGAGPNDNIDGDFTMAELNIALLGNNRTLAPGPDGITYTLLRNLPHGDKETLLSHINEHWNTGSLPDEWRTSHITMTPKSRAKKLGFATSDQYP